LDLDLNREGKKTQRSHIHGGKKLHENDISMKIMNVANAGPENGVFFRTFFFSKFSILLLA
jgi:hypothetical protein